MRSETEYRPIDQSISEEDRVLKDPQMQALIRGIKPAVYFGWHFKEDRGPNLETIKTKLAQLGVEAMVLPSGLIVDQKQLEKRLTDEPEVAAAVGWDTQASLESNLGRSSITAEGKERNVALLGFILGYPKSSIESFTWKNDLWKAGVPTYIGEFFLPSETAPPQINERITDDEGRAILERLRLAGHSYKITRDVAFEKAATTEERILANEQYRKNLRQHLEDIQFLCQRYWQLDDRAIDRLLEPRGILFQTTDGKSLYSFTTGGTNSENSPDILHLEETIRGLEPDIKKIVTR